MRLRSVAERLGERFVRPLEIDRLRAWIAPAMEDARAGRPSATFERLEEAIDRLTEEPSGVGFVVPGWLESLEEEVAAFGAQDVADEDWLKPERNVPQVRIALDDARRQVRDWGESLFGTW